MSGKILITGATSSIGRAAILRLADLGIAIKACIHNPDNAGLIDGAGCEITPLDIVAEDSVFNALEDVEKVLFIMPLMPDQGNIGDRFVDLCKDRGVKHVVKVSAMCAKLDFSPIIDKWHYQTDQHLKGSGMNWTLLRGNRFMQTILHTYPPIGGKYRVPLGDCKISIVDARNIGMAAVRVLQEGVKHYGRDYVMTGAEALSMDDVVRIMSEVTGQNVTYENITDRELSRKMESAGVPEWILQAMVELHALFRSGATEPVSSHIEDITGNPPTSFTRFVADYKEQYLDYINQSVC